jgi:hypothetical protein
MKNRIMEEWNDVRMESGMRKQGIGTDPDNQHSSLPIFQIF